MVATRSRGTKARIPFKQVKKGVAGSKRRSARNDKNTKTLVQDINVEEALPTKQRTTSSPRKSALFQWPAEATQRYEEEEMNIEQSKEVLPKQSEGLSTEDSEDTILVGEIDQIGSDSEVSSQDVAEGLQDVSYEDLRSARLLKNKEMITNLGLSKLKGSMSRVAKKRQPARRSRGVNNNNSEPSRRSGRSRKTVDRLGDYVNEEMLELEMMNRRRAAQFRRRSGSSKPGALARNTRSAAAKQTNAKRVYKKVMKEKKEEVELKCSPLKPDKLEWARSEMIKAFAVEYRIDESSLDFITKEQKEAMVSGGTTVLMSKVAQVMESFVLPSMYSDLDMGRKSGYKSASAYFGHPPGVPVGTPWLSRVECSKDAVHGPWVGGIAGSGKTGAYSIVLSGGYEGDKDEGSMFTYTGSGGRNLTGNKRTAPQSSDQELKGGNLALVINQLRKRPLRVVRGYKARGNYAPQQGYRYDGLYRLVEVWPEEGPSGFVIWRYKMERVENQDQAPWDVENWRELEAEAFAQLEEKNGSNPLIPVGTGTLGLNKEYREMASTLGL